MAETKKSADKKNVVIGVTGSIAAYKACEIVRLCVKRGWNVTVLMTESATKFVSPLTFRTLSKNQVHFKMFDDTAEWRPEHISIAESADVLAVAPCTANVIAKMASGIADDILTSTLLAAKSPVIVAPAMNANMYEHPATQANIRTLQSRGVRVLDAGSGELACGTSGAGRLAEPSAIVSAIAEAMR